MTSTRVYVGNLPWLVSWQDLKDHMRQAGEVTRSDVFLDESGRSKGCGVVEYSTPEAAQRAIETLNDTTIKEHTRMIFVREDREDKSFSSNVMRNGHGRYNDKNDIGRKVYVGNLSYSISWQDLKDKFRECGNVVRAEILLNQDGKSRGSGTVVYSTPSDAQRAIAVMNGVDFRGRSMDVRMFRIGSSGHAN